MLLLAIICALVGSNLRWATLFYVVDANFLKQWGTWAGVDMDIFMW